jgi:hypothetical protein
MVAEANNNKKTYRHGSRSHAANGGNDHQEDQVAKVDFHTIQNGEPNTGTGKVNSSTVHVHRGPQRYDKAGNRRRDTARRFQTL